MKLRYYWDMLDDGMLGEVASFLKWDVRSIQDFLDVLRTDFPFQCVHYTGAINAESWLRILQEPRFVNVREIILCETTPLFELLPVLVELSRTCHSEASRRICAPIYVNSNQLDLLVSCLELCSSGLNLELEVRFDPNFVRDFSEVSKLLQGRNPGLKRLNCCRRWKLRTCKNSLRSNQAHELLVALGANRSLIAMSLDGCKIEPSQGFQAQPNRTCKILHIAYSALNEWGVDLLASVVASSKALEELTVSHCNLGSDNSTRLLQSIAQNCSLKSVNLDGNKLGSGEGLTVGVMLKENKNLESLNLAKNNIGDIGARAIAQGLEQNRILKELDLSQNCIRYNGGKDIGNALALNRTLERLCLADNAICNAIDFGIALALNKALLWLDLRWNGIDGLESKLNELSVSERCKVLWKTHTWRSLGSQGHCR